jgi:hypothetical protein
MIQTFPEVVIGGVLVAPFVLDAGIALVIWLLLRPFFHLIRFDDLFSNPPVAQLSIYVLILASVIVFL